MSASLIGRAEAVKMSEHGIGRLVHCSSPAKITLSFAVTADGVISIGIDGSMTDELTHTLVLALVPAKS
jgi:hypothetical protein